MFTSVSLLGGNGPFTIFAHGKWTELFYNSALRCPVSRRPWPDTGYPHDGRADNAVYRHDRRADKRRYRHDREIDIQMLNMFRNCYILS